MTQAETFIPEAPLARPQPEGGWRAGLREWGVPASALVHVLLFLALARLAGIAEIPLPPQASVAVEILNSEQFQAITRRRTPLVAPAPLEAAPPKVAALPPAQTEPEVQRSQQPRAMVRATRLMAATALARPENREARASLATLISSEHDEQLCNVEAMAQIRALDNDLKPDRLVAYAMADMKRSGTAILADGAAFRSDRRWFNLRYRCELTIDREKVAAFEFQVGDPVPEEDWEAHDLSVID